MAESRARGPDFSEVQVGGARCSPFTVLPFTNLPNLGRGKVRVYGALVDLGKLSSG
jgi:hypothetical protein